MWRFGPTSTCSPTPAGRSGRCTPSSRNHPAPRGASAPAGRPRSTMARHPTPSILPTAPWPQRSLCNLLRDHRPRLARAARPVRDGLRGRLARCQIRARSEVDDRRALVERYVVEAGDRERAHRHRQSQLGSQSSAGVGPLRPVARAAPSRRSMTLRRRKPRSPAAPNTLTALPRPAESFSRIPTARRTRSGGGILPGARGRIGVDAAFTSECAPMTEASDR